MKKPDAYALAAHLFTALVPLLFGALGGMLLFSGDSPAVRGFGLTLIVLVPWALTELTKERPAGRRR